MTMGRPSKYTQDLAIEFCDLVAEGLTVTSICERDGMPVRSTIFKWLAENKSFSDQYARAKEMQAERMADDLLNIADDGTNDYITRQSSDGSIQEVLNSEHIQRSRLRVDTRKWLMSKMLPKKYGDKVEVEHAGHIKVEKIEVEIVDPSEAGRQGV